MLNLACNDQAAGGCSPPFLSKTIRLDPHDSSPRGIFVRSLNDNWSFAFNFESPNGVVLLSKIAAERLSELSVNAEGGIPLVLRCESQIDTLLAKRGLIILEKSPTGAVSIPVPQAKQKSLNVWLHLVNACNFRCHYCYIPELGHKIDPATIERLSIPKRSCVSDNSKIICLFANRTPLIFFTLNLPEVNRPLIYL